ncbi:hypothetical protein SCOCK_10233 [Actinacidiphila cocklensis]|uniref:Amidohydrolase-related domain-containing protein n=1 Tax=Actinacidiphila cocklensis TaxID=887465 RepID=A0A9W4E1B1_9ACTN|nr:hypothetical protein SCOCK_10233 [Actinacidiphila cocklensis]
MSAGCCTTGRWRAAGLAAGRRWRDQGIACASEYAASIRRRAGWTSRCVVWPEGLHSRRPTAPEISGRVRRNSPRPRPCAPRPSCPHAASGSPTRGAVVPGARADLLLLDGDPIADIRATRATRRPRTSPAVRVRAMWNRVGASGVLYSRSAVRPYAGSPVGVE